jgi:hypothetical protein
MRGAGGHVSHPGHLARAHRRTKTYSTPTACDQCGARITGVRRQGVRCKGIDWATAATWLLWDGMGVGPNAAALIYSCSLCVQQPPPLQSARAGDVPREQMMHATLSGSTRENTSILYNSNVLLMME